MFDDRKRRVTDLKECNRVTLPKPMKEIDEALIEIRRDAIGKIFGEHRDANCKKDVQPNNSTQAEAEGLESLQKKIQKKDLIILKRINPENFVQLARKNTERWALYTLTKTS